MFWNLNKWLHFIDHTTFSIKKMFWLLFFYIWRYSEKKHFASGGYGTEKQGNRKFSHYKKMSLPKPTRKNRGWSPSKELHLKVPSKK
jgi:hypothetical protein